MARLIVKNFSCIKEVDIEISNLTILIGGQASGKSLLGKLVWFLTNALIAEIDFATGDYLTQIRNYIKKDFYRYFYHEALGENDFTICYILHPLAGIPDWDISVTITGNNQQIDITFSDIFTILYEELQKKLDEFLKKEQSATHWLVTGLLSSELKSTLYDKSFQHGAFFVPDARARFVERQYSNDVFSNIYSDETVKHFGKFYALLADGVFERPSGLGGFNQKPFNYFLVKEKERTIKAEILRENNEMWLMVGDNRKIRLVNASSGQKELYPLLGAFDYIYRKAIKFSQDTFIIEEPEAHLFPDTQGMITKFIAELAMMRYEDAPNHINHMFITTHSPYILSQVNNLLEAGRLAKHYATNEEKLAQIENIVEREYWLDEEKVRVYCLKDGSAESVMENGVINGAYLDSLSDDIMDDFNALMRLSLEDKA